VDDQVKVLGHRIEPAEIARTLEGHPGVLSAAVIARTRPGQDTKTLYAYVIAHTASDDGPALLEAYLAERLPGYMMPAVIVMVDEIPRNVNGKVDSKALPDPFAASGDVEVGAPIQRDEIATAVAAIWARILQLDAGRVDDYGDFNQLGGNSLQMLSMLTGICNEVVGRQGEKALMAKLAQVIREPTLSRLTCLVRETRAEYPAVVGQPAE
jgi:hypothetical protein